MPTYTIFTDIQISKSKRAHAVYTEVYAKHRWYPTIVEALDDLFQSGQTEALIAGDDKCFHIAINRATPAQLAPMLEAVERGQSPDMGIDPSQAPK